MSRKQIVSYFKNLGLSDSKYNVFAKGRNLSVGKYTHLEFAKKTNVSRNGHVTTYLIAHFMGSEK